MGNCNGTTQSTTLRAASAREDDAGGSRAVASESSGHVPMEEDERELVLHCIRTWARNPRLILHRVVGIVVRTGGILRHEELVEQVGLRTGVRNPGALVAGLLTSTGENAYGRVFEKHNGAIRLHPAIESDVRSFDWE